MPPIGRMQSTQPTTNVRSATPVGRRLSSTNDTQTLDFQAVYNRRLAAATAQVPQAGPAAVAGTPASASPAAAQLSSAPLQASTDSATPAALLMMQNMLAMFVQSGAMSPEAMQSMLAVVQSTTQPVVQRVVQPAVQPGMPLDTQLGTPALVQAPGSVLGSMHGPSPAATPVTSRRNQSAASSERAAMTAHATNAMPLTNMRTPSSNTRNSSSWVSTSSLTGAKRPSDDSMSSSSSKAARCDSNDADSDLEIIDTDAAPVTRNLGAAFK